jgi:hypothetical protein
MPQNMAYVEDPAVASGAAEMLVAIVALIWLRSWR